MFLKLLDMSINAGWLILAVIVFRIVFKKAPKWLFCALWGLVGLRLMFPVTIESRFSIIPDTTGTVLDVSDEPKTDPTFTVQTPDSERTLKGIPVILEKEFTEDLDVRDQNGNALTWNDYRDLISNRKSIDNRETDIGFLRYRSPLLSVIWLAGAAVLFIYALTRYISLKRKVSTAIRLENNVYQSEFISSPFLLGIIKPRIYIPMQDYEATVVSSGESADESSGTKTDLDYVLAHERAHLARRDNWVKLLGYILLTLYWFNPLIWIAFILLCRDIESACDERVVSSYDEDERRQYSTALMHASIGAGNRKIAACPLAFGEVSVKTRIKNVMNYKKPAFWVTVISAVICIVLGICFLTNPKKAEQDSDDAVAADIGGDNSLIKIRIGMDDVKDMTGDSVEELAQSSISVQYVSESAETDEYGHKIREGGEMVFSDAMHEDLRKNWEEWNKKDSFSQAFSSTLPGHLYKYFSSWDEMTDYIGTEILNPLEAQSWLEHRANPYQEKTDSLYLSRCSLYWTGNRDNSIVSADAWASYTHGQVRFQLMANISERRDAGDGEICYYEKTAETNEYGLYWITREVCFYYDGFRYTLRIWDSENEDNLNNLMARACECFNVNITADSPEIRRTEERIPGTDVGDGVDFYK